MKHSINSTGWLPILPWVFGLLLACNPPGSNQGSDVLATYGNQQLLLAEVLYFLPSEAGPVDSQVFVRQYVEEWLEGQAIASEAIQQIGDLPNRLGYRLERERLALAKHEYAKWLVSNQLDSMVDEQDIRDYYQANIEDFEAQERLYCYFHVITSEQAQGTVMGLMQSRSPADIADLKTWCAAQAISYKLDSIYVNEASIQTLDDAFTYGSPKYAAIGRVYPFTERIDGQKVYHYFKVVDKVKPGEALPLTACRSQIRDILLNRRTNSLIEQTQAALVQQAKAAGKIKVYTE